MIDMNDVIFSLGGVSHITEPLGIDATDAQIAAHLSANVIGEVVPTLSQVKAQILVYIAQIEKSNADAIKSTMQPLTAWQIRKVLIQFGLRDQVEAAIAQSSLSMQDAWHYASQFKRDDDTLLAAALALNITDAQLDTMFEVGVNL